ncbi:MAG: SWIM zinc finger family protein, partial [Deltaproteobacteria bacterium]|nr:SWIM zinc finger family protein [Deltaproteobacteria bacterium]
MAGARSFERGEEYFNSCLVSNLVEKNEILSARVRGTHKYTVKLWVDKGKLDYSCTCPVGDDGMFCKHCVAVGLTWLEGEKKDRIKRQSPEAPAVTMKDIRAYLDGEDKNSLVDMLMERAKDDERLERRLMTKAAKKRAKGLNLSAYRKAIDIAVDTDGFVDYRSAYGYADGVIEAIDSIDELLKDGYAAEAVELAEYALGSVEEALGSIDDSDGHMSEVLYRIEEIHLMACKKARPDSEALARRLFEWQMRTEWDTFRNATATYSKVL